MRSKVMTVLAVVLITLYLGLNLLPDRYVVNMPISIFKRSSVSESNLPGSLILPDGFKATIFAQDLGRARFMKITDRDDLIVTLPKSGRVVLLKADQNGDGKSDDRINLLENLSLPHGLDILNGWLYIAEVDAVGRIQFNADSGTVVGSYQRIIEGLPGSSGHWTRTLRFGPDGLMYVSVGSSCNVCIEDDENRAAMLRFNPDGTGRELFATGLRNSVGFDWSPANGALYATDNGRDLLGDDFPPDELNQLVKGGFYGWPFAHGNKQPDPEYGSGHAQEIENSIVPVHHFRAHNAPLGIKFLRSDSLPDNFRSAALVALHGSWNRSEKDGYKVVSMHMRQDGTFVEKDFMSGFEKNEKVIGRPVDIEESSDGIIYVSDDFAGVIYRIFYQK